MFSKGLYPAFKKLNGKLFLVILTLMVISCVNKTAEQCYLKGAISDSLDNEKKAIRYYNMAIAKNPRNPDFYVSRANARVKTIKPKNRAVLLDKVILDYNNAIEIQPWHFSAVFSRAKYWYYYINDKKKAVDDLDSLIKKYPQRTESFELLSQIYMEDQDISNATLNYNHLLELGVSRTKVYRNMANNEYIFGFYDQAISHYQKLIELGDHLVDTESNKLAMSYWKTNKKDSACLFYKKNSNTPELINDFGALAEYCK